MSGQTSERRFSFLLHSMPRSSRSCCLWSAAVPRSSLAIDVRESGMQFWNAMNRHRVTFISSVPTYLESILDNAQGAPFLEHIALGGEAFTDDLKNRLYRQFGASQITNLYGPTETTIDAISFRVPHASMGRQIPIGKPMPNYRAYVLDDGLQPAACWRVRGTLHFRAGRCAGLPGPCGPDGGAVCRGPAWRAGQPDVPDRGPCAVAF